MLLSELKEVENGRCVTLDADKGEHWVTIKKSEEGKGRKVLLDKDGNIIGGDVPKSFQGKHISKMEQKKHKEKTIKNPPRLVKIDKLVNSPDILKHLRVPEYMYHVTSKSNLKSIMSKGLQQSEKQTKEGGNFGVYLTNDPDDIIEHQEDFKIPEKDIVILKVKTKGLNLRIDPEYVYGSYSDSKEDALEYVESVNEEGDQFALYSKEVINPKNIVSHKFLKDE